MPYQKELNFICEVFKKSRINYSIVKKTETDKSSTGTENDIFDTHAFFSEIVGNLKHGKLYRYTDNLSRSYRFMLLPSSSPENALCLGPFLSEAVSPQRILELCETNGVSPQTHRAFNEYFSTLPIINDNSHILIMLYTFCETVWNSRSITIVDFKNENAVMGTPFSKTLLDEKNNDEIIGDKTLERRYGLENELIRAVKLGQNHLINNFKSFFSHEVFEKRSENPLQNAKNYCIIMNTILRKAAEQGGVHPKYINQISTDFALKIENLSSSSSASALMADMFQAYCRMVRKHNTKKYPLIVQKTILTIDADLSANLSTKQLALKHGVTLGYLSAVFKKATGLTVSEYVCKRRMEYAEYLLAASRLQIQTIATHCGIIDTQYFSKLFKRHSGMSPLQFRNKARPHE